MSLPILQATRRTSAETLVRLFYQTETYQTRNIAQEQPLEFGTAFFNADLSAIDDANRMLSAALPAGLPPAEAVAAADALFHDRGTSIAMWVMNPSSPPDRTAPLGLHLRHHGFGFESLDILHLAQVPRVKLDETDLFKIIPARASFRHVREIASQAVTAPQTTEMADAMLLHLDDSHVDALLALKDRAAAGYVAVLAAGEVGRIDDLFVVPRFRRQGIGRMLTSRALEICARSLFRHVLVSCSPNDLAAQSLYRQFGFEKIGAFEFYRRSPQATP